MKKAIVSLGLLFISITAIGADMANGANNFYRSDQVTVQKVTLRINIR